MADTIIGAVLAGGASRRLGRDKARVTLSGTTLLDRAVEVLSSVFARVVVSVGEQTATNASVPAVRDVRRGLGPVAALETVFRVEPRAPVFILACDLPFVDARVVRRVVEAAGDESGSGRPRAWIGCEEGRLQPLCGLYAPGCEDAVTANLDSGRLSFRELFEQIQVVGVDVGDLGSDLLMNVNLPSDLERARMLSGGC